MNGDGYDDLFLTNTHRYVSEVQYAGVVWLVLGPVTGDADIDAIAQARIDGGNRFDAFSTELATRGDLDGDGHLDLVAGVSPSGNGYTPAVDPGVRLFFGPLSGTMNFQDGIEFQSRRTGYTHIDQDLDGDGIDDMIMADSNMYTSVT